jgi:DNA-binding PadR family transcriptional regulator
MVLGTLARYGPTHGHKIRRLAEISNVDEWCGVSVGALYRELRVMEGEGLVEAVRTEQVGRRPARTVYSITGEGRLELALLRHRALNEPSHGPDPVGVALSFSAQGADREELTGQLHARREHIAILAQQLRAKQENLEPKGYLDAFEAAVIRRAEMHAETEVRWHDEFAKILAGLPTKSEEGTRRDGDH